MKLLLTINSRAYELEMQEDGTAAVELGSAGKAEVRLIKVLQEPTEQRTGSAMVRVKFDMGNTADTIAAIPKKESRVIAGIRAQLTHKGMTQKGLAEKLGINPVSLSAMLRGGNLTLATLEKFATAIGCEVADFFAQPKHVCPHCGKEIKITIQE